MADPKLNPVERACAKPIITDFWRKPIPTNAFDWVAYRDPEEAAGYGATEQEAIADLLENEDD